MIIIDDDENNVDCVKGCKLRWNPDAVMEVEGGLLTKIQLKITLTRCNQKGQAIKNEAWQIMNQTRS